MDRILEITKILLEHDQPITISSIAEQLQVSSRTVRYDLKKLNDLICRSQISHLALCKKTGVGIRITGDAHTKQLLLEKIKESLKEKAPCSPEERKDYILSELFFSQSKINMKDLADQLYVSRATIYKDLMNIEEWLKPYRVQINNTKKQGIELMGKEEDLRNAISELMITYGKQEELSKSFKFVTKDSLLKLKSLIDIDYLKIEEIVSSIEKELEFKFSREAFASLVLHIAIAIKRLMEGKDIQLTKEILDQLLKREEAPIAKKMAKDIQKAFGVNLPDEEIGYLLLHIIGAKKRHNDKAFNIDLVNEEDLATIMAKEIIEISERAISLPLTQDKQLLNGLILHLRPTINRLKYGLTLKNPIIEDIKQNYPDIYGVAWMTSVVFEKYLDQNIGEEEIGYLAMHIGASVERNKNLYRVLVICHSGIGTSQLLSARLKRAFRQIEIVDIISSLECAHFDLTNIDFILSTVPITSTKTVIEVSPVLTQYDIKKIQNYLQNMNNGAYHKDKKLFIDQDLISVEEAHYTKEELIFSMVEKLVNKNLVSEDFVKDVLTRERLAPTVIGHGIAIPHGSPEKVYKSCVAATILSNPIIWGDEKVSMVLMLCISVQDLPLAKQFFGHLYEKIDLEDSCSQIYDLDTKDKLIRFLEGLINVNE